MVLLGLSALASWVASLLSTKPKHIVLLVDNGSLRAEAVLNLREIAKQLQRRLPSDVRIVPASARFADRVPTAWLGGLPGLTITTFMRSALLQGHRSFTVLPMFFGPSETVRRYIPSTIRRLTRDYPDARVQFCDHLIDVESDDDRVARALAERVRERLRQVNMRRANVVVVDHGTPTEAVHLIREHLARQLRGLLSADECGLILTASMDRRRGAEYDFNEPMLEQIVEARPDLKEQPGFIAALAFLSPGRHAGYNGDLFQILEFVQSEHNVRGFMTRLLGEHPLIHDVLLDRLGDKLGVAPSPPVSAGSTPVVAKKTLAAPPRAAPAQQTLVGR